MNVPQTENLFCVCALLNTTRGEIYREKSTPCSKERGFNISLNTIDQTSLHFASIKSILSIKPVEGVF